MRTDPIGLSDYGFETEELVDSLKNFDRKEYDVGLPAFTESGAATPTPSIDPLLCKPVICQTMKKRIEILEKLENLGSDNLIILSKWR